MTDEPARHRKAAGGVSDFVRVTRGAAAFLVGTGVGMVSGILTTIVLTRTLGIDGYGALALGLAIVTVTQTVTSLGLAGGTSRMLAFAKGKKDELGARRIFNASLLAGMTAAVAGVAVLLLIVAVGVTDGVEVSLILVVVSPLLVAGALRSSFYGSLRAYQDVRALFLASVTVPLFDIVAIVGLALLGVENAAAYAVALVAAAYSEVVLLAILLRRHGRFGPVFETTWKEIKGLVSFSLPFVLVQFMNLAIHQSDVVLLGVFHDPATVGLYTPVMRLGQTVEKLLSAFPLLYLPVATGYFAQGRIGDIRQLYLAVTKWAYAIAFLVLLGIVVTPGAILPLLFGSPYAEMVTEARVLAIGYWSALLTGLNGVTLGALGLQKRAAGAAIVAIAVNLVAAFLLIPPLGALGAAWSNTIAYVAVNVLLSVLLFRHSGITPFRRDTTSLYVYSVVVVAVGLAATQVLSIEETAQGLVLLVVLSCLWLGGVMWGRLFNLEWAEMRDVISVRRSRKEATPSIRSFPSETLPRRVLAHHDNGVGAPPPFPFFVGRGRSGTTLVRAIFSSHPALAIPPESPFVVSMARRRALYERDGRFQPSLYLEELLVHPRFSLWDLPDDIVREAFAFASPTSYADAVRTLYALYAAGQGKSDYGDKSPRTSGALPLLARLFPEARFIHIIRDGRDVALSHLDVGFGAVSVVQAAVDWKRQVGECRRDGRALGERRYREVRYEDLVEDPEATVADVCRFLEIPFDEGMLRYFERADEVIGTTPTPAAHRHLAAPPTKGLRDWRSQMTSEHVALFEVLAGDMLQDLGYELADHPTSVSMRATAVWSKAQIEIPRHIRRLRNHDFRKRAARYGRLRR